MSFSSVENPFEEPIERETPFTSPPPQHTTPAFIAMVNHVEVWGGGVKEKVPAGQFLRLIEYAIDCQRFEDEKAKVKMFQQHIKYQSPADKWWDKLKDEEKTTLEVVLVLFKKEWKVGEKEVSNEDAVEELKGHVLKSEDLGEKVDSGGGDTD